MKQLTAAALAATVLLLAGCGANQPEPAKTPTTFKVTGGIAVNAALGSEDAMGGDCFTDGGFSDIAPGTQVTIKDASSKVLALGNLGAGRVTELFGDDTVLPGSAYKCTFYFSVENVPEGESIYSIEVAHRGELRYSRVDMGASLALKLS
jgi:hypothetical protein